MGVREDRELQVWVPRGAGKFSVSSDRVKHAQQPELGVTPFLTSIVLDKVAEIMFI